MEMREGNLFKNIFIYSIPLMFTNLLQVFFNLADVAVVGKFAGSIALGAVGSTTILITLTTGWLIGMANGVNALTALFIGASEKDSLEKCIHTGILLCLAMGLFVLGVGEFFAVDILKLLGTKDELIDQAIIYFRIYMLGSPGLALYNYGNAVLSAKGDTKRPLKYLTIAGIINVILNLVFVISFSMSADGVAIASITAEYISAILVLKAVIYEKDDCKLVIKKISFDGAMAIRILKISIPTALQYSMFAIANLFVQSAVNSFDHITVEGNSAAANADSIIYNMMAAFYTASTSFIAQNYGAGNISRIKKTYFITTLYSFGLGLILGLLLYIFKTPFLMIFTNDVDVVETGIYRISIMAFSYGISAFMDNATAACRGIGKTYVPTIILILGAVVFRITWIMTVFAYYRTIQSLFLLYASSWIFTAIIENIYFYRQFKKINIPL